MIIYILIGTYRGRNRRCSIKKDVLENFAEFTWKHLYRSLFFNKVTEHQPGTLKEKRLPDKCFPVNFVIFLGTAFLQNSSWRLFLRI